MLIEKVIENYSEISPLAVIFVLGYLAVMLAVFIRLLRKTKEKEKPKEPQIQIRAIEAAKEEPEPEKGGLVLPEPKAEKKPESEKQLAQQLLGYSMYNESHVLKLGRMFPIRYDFSIQQEPDMSWLMRKSLLKNRRYEPELRPGMRIRVQGKLYTIKQITVTDMSGNSSNATVVFELEKHAENNSIRRYRNRQNPLSSTKPSS